MSDFSALICCPSPRDIPQVWKSVNAIKGVPKLWIKYYTEANAYRIIEHYFLEHSDADYLIISPDDLVARNEDYLELVKTINDFGGPEKIPVLSGVCNLHNMPGCLTQLAICIDHEIHPQRRRRHYIWSDTRHYNWAERGYDKMRLLPVKFSGFPFQFIRRDIVQEIGLHGDREFNELHKQQQDYSFDVIFCYLCNHHTPEPIPIYVNPQVWMLHLRGSHPREVEGIEPLLVGQKDPQVLYVEGDDEAQKQTDITELCKQYATASQPKIVPAAAAAAVT